MIVYQTLPKNITKDRYLLESGAIAMLEQAKDLTKIKK
jgi:hypothetical protein